MYLYFKGVDLMAKKVELGPIRKSERSLGYTMFGFSWASDIIAIYSFMAGSGAIALGLNMVQALTAMTVAMTFNIVLLHIFQHIKSRNPEFEGHHRRIFPSSAEKALLASRRLFNVSKSPDESQRLNSQSRSMAVTRTSGSPSLESRRSAPM